MFFSAQIFEIFSFPSTPENFENFKNSLHLTKTVRLVIPNSTSQLLAVNIEKLQNDFDCKIFLSEYHQNDEERNIFIQSNKDDQNVAVEARGRFYVVDSQDDLVVEEALVDLSKIVAEIAGLISETVQSSYFHNMPASSSDSNAQVMEARLLLYFRSAGLIIGKGGSTITGLENQTGSKLKIKELNCPDSSDKLILISGNNQAVQDSTFEILKTLRTANIYNENLCNEIRNLYECHFNFKNNDEMPDYGAYIKKTEDHPNLIQPTKAEIENFNNKNKTSSYFTIRFLIPAKIAGIIIGKGAEVRKRLISEYNVGINMRRDRNNETEERVVEIYSDNTNQAVKVSKVRECFREILDILAEPLAAAAEEHGYPVFDGKQPVGRKNEEENPDFPFVLEGFAPNNTTTDLKLLIDIKNISHIVGKNGCKIAQLRVDNGTAVKVFQVQAPNSSEKILSISGTVDGIYQTCEDIFEIMAEFNHHIDERYNGEYNFNFYSGYQSYGGFMTRYGEGDGSVEHRAPGGGFGRGSFGSRGRGSGNSFNQRGGRGNWGFNRGGFNQNNGNTMFGNQMMMNQMAMYNQMAMMNQMNMMGQMNNGMFGGLNMMGGNSQGGQKDGSGWGKNSQQQ